MSFHEKVSRIKETVFKSEEYAPIFKELNQRCVAKTTPELEQDKSFKER